MTPLEIGVLLHYYTTPGDYAGVSNVFDYHCPPGPWQECLRKFIDSGLLRETLPDEVSTQRLHLAERGRAYVEAIMAVPMPQKVWVTEYPTAFKYR